VVLAATICNAENPNALEGSHVVRMTLVIPRMLQNAFIAGKKNILVFCDEKNPQNVIHCVPLANTMQFPYDGIPSSLGLSFAGAAVAHYYKKEGGCTYEADKVTYEDIKASMVLTDCNAVQMTNTNKIIISGDNFIAAHITKDLFDQCQWSPEKTVCSLMRGTLSMENQAVWKLLTHPVPQLGRGLLHRCEKLYECTSCNAHRVCLPRGKGVYYEYKSKSCTSQNPYCNYKTGTCQKNPDASCLSQLPRNVQSNEFGCMRNGMFPDPLSCNKFYTCDKFSAWVHYCPDVPTPYYHPDLQICVASDEFCVSSTSTPECKKPENQGQKIPIFGTKNYFISCGSGEIENEPIPIDMCVGAYTFDTSDMSCKFRKCPHEGLFLYAGDCYKYIMCTPLPLPKGEFTMTVGKCPEGKAFSEKEYQCIDKSLVAYCDIEIMKMDSDHKLPDSIKE